VLQRNYLDVYPYDRWEGIQLPDFHQGETFMPSVCELREGQTSSPNLLTEADLVSLMDKNGIGALRPSLTDRQTSFCGPMRLKTAWCCLRYRRYYRRAHCQDHR
jgi:hypothetical protein